MHSHFFLPALPHGAPAQTAGAGGVPALVPAPAGCCSAGLGTWLFAGLCFSAMNNGLLAAQYFLSCSIYLSQVK